MSENKFVGPQRTWKCESGKHEAVIESNSIFTVAWAIAQEQGKVGPLVIPDVSCHLCHPRSNNLKINNHELA